MRSFRGAPLPWGAISCVAAALCLLTVPCAASDDVPKADLLPQFYGIYDIGVRHVGRVAAAAPLTQFVSGLNTSRWGLIEVVPIDADWRARIRLEGGFNSSSGSLSNSKTPIDRIATIGVGWRGLDFRTGRVEGFGYKLAADGTTDPLSMALNLPNYSSPAAAGSKAAVLGANPLQALYSYTYGQLRYNSAFTFTGAGERLSWGALSSLGGAAGSLRADAVRGVKLQWRSPPVQFNAIVQQSLDASGRLSTLEVAAGTWSRGPWRLQAALHRLRIGAGFDSSGLGNGASSSVPLGSSTTVSTDLAPANQDFHLQVADLGATRRLGGAYALTLAGYQTRTEGAGPGRSLATVALLTRRLTEDLHLYLEADHANSSGSLAVRTLSSTATSFALMCGMNLRF